MATSTFSRKIELNNEKSVDQLVSILTDKKKPKPLSSHPYTDADRKKGEELLKRYLSHSSH